MSNGPLGPGECSQTRIKAISDLFITADPQNFINPTAFVNPQFANIVNMGLGADNAMQQANVYRAYLMSIVPPPPNIAALLAQVQEFEDLIDAPGGFRTSVLQYQEWTNFISGKSQVFPIGELDTQLLFPGGDPQGWVLLGTLGFAGMVGLVKGGNQAAYVKCEVDPSDPCYKVKKILGAVTGAFDAALNTIINGLNAMIDFASHIADYIAQVTGFIEDVVAIVANAIAELAQQLVSLIRDGLSKLLDGVKLDPCMGAVLQNIAGVDLKTALGI